MLKHPRALYHLNTPSSTRRPRIVVPNGNVGRGVVIPSVVRYTVSHRIAEISYTTSVQLNMIYLCSGGR
eukprot:5255503-Prymnesium_polylepis.1